MFNALRNFTKVLIAYLKNSFVPGHVIPHDGKYTPAAFCFSSHSWNPDPVSTCCCLQLRTLQNGSGGHRHGAQAADLHPSAHHHKAGGHLTTSQSLFLQFVFYDVKPGSLFVCEFLHNQQWSCKLDWNNKVAEHIECNYIYVCSHMQLQLSSTRQPLPQKKKYERWNFPGKTVVRSTYIIVNIVCYWVTSLPFIVCLSSGRHGDAIMSVLYECYSRPYNVSSIAQYFVLCLLVIKWFQPWTQRRLFFFFFYQNWKFLERVQLFWRVSLICYSNIFYAGKFICTLVKCNMLKFDTRKSWWTLWCHFVKVTCRHTEMFPNNMLYWVFKNIYIIFFV